MLELEIKKLNFPCFHVFRPGLLNRKKKSQRTLENLALKMMPSLGVDKLASFMVKQSLDSEFSKDDKKVKVFQNKDILLR